MAMKIVRPICAGLDVHKNLIVATIGITDPKTNILNMSKSLSLV